MFVFIKENPNLSLVAIAIESSYISDCGGFLHAATKCCFGRAMEETSAKKVWSSLSCRDRKVKKALRPI